jgi:hypothetical protein
MGNVTAGNLLTGVSNNTNIPSNTYTGTGLVGSTTAASGTTITYPSWQTRVSFTSGMAMGWGVDLSDKSVSPAHEKATEKLKRMLGKIL